jgi:acyl carrier protein
VPVSGREHADVERVVGFFLNTVLFRHHINPETSFIDFLQSVKQTVLRGMAHQQYPFEKLIEDLDLPREPNRFPVTPVLLNVLNFFEAGALNRPEEGPDHGAHAIGRSVHYNVSHEAKAELELYVIEHNDAIRLRCQYRCDLFKPDTIEYLLNEFVSLLQQLAQSPEKSLHAYRAFSDRQVLAGRLHGRQEQPADKPYMTPAGETEQKLAAIWSEILQVERVGRDDDFFAIGGHSLKALQMISRARKAFEVRVEPRMLFESPTLAGFAARIGEGGRQAFDPIEPAGERPRYPASAAQFSLWLQHELNPQSAAYNIASMVELPPEWQAETLHRVIAQMADRHESLRTVFERDGEDLYQRIQPAGDIGRLEEVAVDSEEALRALRLRYSRQPFDLARGPLFRSRLINTWDGRCLLFFCMHEIIADGSSTVILQNEIARLQDAYRSGRENVLPPLPIQ